MPKSEMAKSSLQQARAAGFLGAGASLLAHGSVTIGRRCGSRVPVPVNVQFTGQGVAANAQIGNGSVLIAVELTDIEVISLLMAA